LDNLKSKASVEDNQNSMLATGTKVWLDHVNIQDDIIPKLEEELQQTFEININQRLKLLGMLISMYSRQKNQYMTMKYFDQARNGAKVNV
jgi:hypothetical protein